MNNTPATSIPDNTQNIQVGDRVQMTTAAIKDWEATCGRTCPPQYQDVHVVQELRCGCVIADNILFGYAQITKII